MRRLAPVEMLPGAAGVFTHSLDDINFQRSCRQPLTIIPLILNLALYGGKQSESTPFFRFSRPSNLRILRIAQQKAAFCNEERRRRRHPRSLVRSFVGLRNSAAVAS